ncbi:MAG: helix-turn-helix domain-containing protein [Clostridia bacterium]|nr:helix-turn-helix domain-containing protein [Clostridia bacterium]
MIEMKLEIFAEDATFPFFIRYGGHVEDLYVHRHVDFSELVIVLGGSAEHVVGDERYPIGKGDVFVVGMGNCHGYEKVSNLRLCNVMFRPEVMLSGDYDVTQLPGFHALFLVDPHFHGVNGFLKERRLPAERFAVLYSMADEAIREYDSENPGRKTLLFTYFMQMVVYLSRMYDYMHHVEANVKDVPDMLPAPQGLAENDHAGIDGIARAAAFMEAHYMEEIREAQLLEISHFSKRHFIRRFSAVYHISPQKYLLRLRIRHACTLLRDSTLAVTDVALRCGFSDANYFSRVFRRERGVTPTQYRSGV